MKETRILMGMPVSVEIVDCSEEKKKSIEDVFVYLTYIDNTFNTYKPESEISCINRGEIQPEKYSTDMKEVFALSEETKKLTDGYFDIATRDGRFDPSGLVKGWAIWKAAEILKRNGHKNFFVDAGGDIQTSGRNKKENMWSVGIRDPFDKTGQRIVKIVQGEDLAVATSGTYVRGQHIYNPKSKHSEIHDIISLTVVGKNIYEADRFATAAFAMGTQGIMLIEKLPNIEGFMIDVDGIGMETSGFEKYSID